MASPPSSTTEAQQSAGDQTTGNAFHEANIDMDTNEDTDSAFGSSIGSETTSIASQYHGYIENGRRYQNVKSEQYFMPPDEKQWDSMQAGHMLMLILDSQRSNTLFRSPISSKAQHIIDLGTGHGDWALDVADRYPNVTVHGVDLTPPPQEWTAPNCVFEVDDISKPCFSNAEWDALYPRCYENIVPGGWIEQVELDVNIKAIDDSMPEDSVLNWKDTFDKLGEASGRPFDVRSRMEQRMKDAGFINVSTQDYKVPVGTWPKLQIYKDAGRVNKTQIAVGMEGWTMFLLTQFGMPEPWSVEEVQAWLAKVKQELNAGYRIYQVYTRAWGQKPADA